MVTLINLVNLVQQIINGIGSMFDSVEYLLTSPFERVRNAITDSNVLSMLNWLMPISEAVALAQLWAFAVMGWYVAMTALRWIKTIS